MVSVEFHVKDRHTTSVDYILQENNEYFVTLKLKKYPEELTLFFENWEHLEDWLKTIMEQAIDQKRKWKKEQ